MVIGNLGCYTVKSIKMCNDNIQPLRGLVTLMLSLPWISSRVIQILALRDIAHFYPVYTIIRIVATMCRRYYLFVERNILMRHICHVVATLIGSVPMHRNGTPLLHHIFFL